MRENEFTNYQADEHFVPAHEKGLESEAGRGDGAPGSMRSNRPGSQKPHVANPDDPPVQRPPQGPKGVMPGPKYLGLAGRIAIVQGQLFIVAVIVIAQLWLITDALYELLSGRPSHLGWLTLASGLGFVLALIVAFWPRRRIVEP
jgi:hypothetical protein